MDPEFVTSMDRYYADRLAHHGDTPKGVDYGSDEAHVLRFRQFEKLLDRSTAFSVLDYGCGYGGLGQYLFEQGYDFGYQGLDVLERMVELGRRNAREGWTFVMDEADLEPADYVLASGIFNQRFGFDDAEWTGYVIETVTKFDRLSRRGFAFNMLTKYSDPPRMREDLHYADPTFYFDLCKLRFSRNVALLHDYGAYEFTILVRK